MNLLVSILWLSDAAVRQGVSNVIRIGSKVFFITRVGNSLLEQISVSELVADPCLQMIQRTVETEMIDQNWQQKSVLYNIRHQTSLVVTLSRDDCSAITFQFGV